MPQERKEFSLGKLQKSLTLPKEEKSLNSNNYLEKKKLNKKPFYFLGIFLLLVILITSVYYFLVYKPQYFYVGNWEAELSQQEKDGGIRLVKYQIAKNEITSDINTDQSGLLVQIITNTKYEIVNSTRNEVVFKVKEGSISNISITIPSSLCESDCEEVRKNLEEQIRKAYNEEFKNLNTTIIKKTDKGIALEDGNGRRVELKR